MSQVKPWARVALAMFAVGWGANQFSTMLIVYRHALGLGPSPIAGLFAIYAAALIPGLLIGGPASDRLGRRAVVIPFTALSPLATLILVVGHDSIAALAAGRALAGLCSGTVFGAATAWCGTSPRAARSALAALPSPSAPASASARSWRDCSLSGHLARSSSPTCRTWRSAWRRYCSCCPPRTRVLAGRAWGAAARPRPCGPGRSG